MLLMEIEKYHDIDRSANSLTLRKKYLYASCDNNLKKKKLR